MECVFSSGATIYLDLVKSLPAEDITVALYMQSIMNSADSFSTIKSASASIAFFHKINVFTNHPTLAREVCMVRTSAARKFGLSPKRVKEPFMWMNLVGFALLYGVHNQGYCHLVVATMAIFSFGTMCRYSDVSGSSKGISNSIWVKVPSKLLLK